MPADHVLTARASLSPVDFEAVAFVSLGANDPSRLQLQQIFEDAGVRRRMTVACQSATGVCELVVQGLGVSIVNPLSALRYKNRGLVIRKFAPHVPFRISSIRPLDRPQQESTDHCLRIISEVCTAFSNSQDLL